VKTAAKSAGLGKTFGLVAILTIFSKLAGLVRDIIVLQALGTSTTSDAYNFAYLLTGNILILFGGLGGPFHSSTVAILTPRKNDPGLGKLAGQLFLFTILILSAISILAWFFAPSLISLIAPAAGHDAAYRADLWGQATNEMKIMVPMIVIAGIVGISYGILNVYGEVFWPSLSPAIASVAIIAAVLMCPDKHSLPLLGIYIAWGTTVGAVGQMIAQLPGLAKSPFKWAVPLQPQPGLRQYFSMLWPAAFSTSIGQLTIYIDSFFTSQLHEGSWTAIVNANRLVQLPLGVLLTAMLVPILPRFTEQVAEKRIDDLKAEFRRALSFLWFLALPIAALMMAIPGPILQVLFERGQFNVESRELVATALIFLVPSIFFYVARDLITRVYYAQHDSTTPYYVAMVAIVVKGLLDWLLVSSLGIGGISLATTLVTVFNLTVLTFFMRRKIGNLGFSALIKPVAIMLFASTACGAVALLLHNLIIANIHFGRFLTALTSVSVASAAGLMAYAVICIIFKLEEPTMLLQRIRSKFNKKQ
jgi:putative peptidoglycan lipid II flippase